MPSLVCTVIVVPGTVLLKPSLLQCWPRLMNKLDNMSAELLALADELSNIHGNGVLHGFKRKPLTY